MAEMFEVRGNSTPLPPLKDKLYGALGAVWKPWTGTRRPCDHCVMRVHQLGIQTAPAVRPATQRRKGPNGELFLCSEDAQNLKELDTKVDRDHKQTSAIAAHQLAGSRAARRPKPRR